MPLSTGIKTQRSAVVLLNGVTFEHNPNNIDGQQQVKEGGIAIEATDSSTIYIKEQIVFNLNADKWFVATNNSNITWLATFNITVSNQASNAAVIPFDLYRNSTIDLKAGTTLGRFNNNSTLTLTQLLSGTKIDTSSSLYINNNLETEVKKDTTEVKGSLNNIFYSAGEPYVAISNTGTLPRVDATEAMAFGPEAIASGGGSIQLGKGTNTKNKTLQLFNSTIADENGTLIKVSDDDQLPGRLFSKMSVAGEAKKRELNEGGNEFIEIQAGLEISQENTTGNVIASDGSLIPIDVTTNARTVTPPSNPTFASLFGVVDSRGNAATNNITIDFISAGENFHSSSQNYVLNTNNEFAKFRYVNNIVGWVKT